LTRYYLFVALGGAAGGLLAALAAPLVFRSVAEYPLALFACAVLTAWRAPKPAFLRSPRAAATVALLCGLAWLTLAQFTARHTSSKTLFRDRNFYGCIAVTQTYERLGEDRHVFPIHYLWCGQTTHGIQIRSADAETRNTATAYYAATGGGIAFLAHPKYQAGEPMKVGIVGLGAGTLACYGRPNDLFRFYEINPQVVKVATDPQLFSFLPDAKMPIDLVRAMRAACSKRSAPRMIRCTTCWWSTPTAATRCPTTSPRARLSGSTSTACRRTACWPCT